MLEAKAVVPRVRLPPFRLAVVREAREVRGTLPFRQIGFDDWQEMLVLVDTGRRGFQIAFNEKTSDGNTQGPNSCANRAAVGQDAACWKYTSTLEFVKGNDPVHYDLIQKTSGEIVENEKLVPYNRSFRHRYRNGRYLREQPQQ